MRPKEETPVHIDPISYLRFVESRIRLLEERTARLEGLVQTLERLLRQLKPVHIDNIHYKIQELHLRDLSGTLNVGLTALTDPQQLEEWLKKQPNPGEIEGHAGAAAEGGGRNFSREEP
ncbi:MAG: hypothetical protein BAA02_06155 [Paenibacillaceae bacterium ZCTH02-B3]|nr:MAG: hypothetical protein BAA02_06155 [Paenibacillaceae bacterium ZCTH02-B3]